MDSQNLPPESAHDHVEEVGQNKRDKWTWLYALGWVVIAALAIVSNILEPFVSSTLTPLIEVLAPGASFLTRSLLSLLAVVIVPFFAGMIAEAVMRAFKGTKQLEGLRLMRKQLTEGGGLEARQAHSGAILSWPNDTLRTVVLVTGTVADPNTGDKLAIVFIPNVPDPTSGSLRVIQARDLSPLPWTREQVLDFYVSFGSLAPVLAGSGEHVLDRKL